MRDIKRARIALRLSQSALARLSGVDRIHICLAELGDRPLNAQEEEKIQKALRWEAERLRDVDVTLPLTYNQGYEETQTQESSGGPTRLSRRKSLGQGTKAANLSAKTERDRANRRRRTVGESR